MIDFRFDVVSWIIGIGFGFILMPAYKWFVGKLADRRGGPVPPEPKK